MRKREDEREETENDHHLIKLTSHNYNYKGGGRGGREEREEERNKAERKESKNNKNNDQLYIVHVQTHLNKIMVEKRKIHAHAMHVIRK